MHDAAVAIATNRATAPAAASVPKTGDVLGFLERLWFMPTQGGNWTWGFQRHVGNDNIRALVAPDYVEKHYPTLDGQGLLYWIENNNCLGSSFIVRQASKGNQHALQEEPNSTPAGSTC